MKPSEDSNRGTMPAYSKMCAASSRLMLEGTNSPATTRAPLAIRTWEILLENQPKNIEKRKIYLQKR